MPLKKATASGRRNEAGAVMLESALAIILLGIVVTFVLDAGVVLNRFSLLSNTTLGLTRFLAPEIGRGWSTGTSGGSCAAFLSTKGSEYLSKLPDSGRFGMGNTAKQYSFSARVISDPDSPYAILQVTGALKPSCITCRFFPKSILTSESSTLIEYATQGCT